MLSNELSQRVVSKQERIRSNSSGGILPMSHKHHHHHMSQHSLLSSLSVLQINGGKRTTLSLIKRHKKMILAAVAAIAIVVLLLWYCLIDREETKTEGKSAMVGVSVIAPVFLRSERLSPSDDDNTDHNGGGGDGGTGSNDIKEQLQFISDTIDTFNRVAVTATTGKRQDFESILPVELVFVILQQKPKIITSGDIIEKGQTTTAKLLVNHIYSSVKQQQQAKASTTSMTINHIILSVNNDHEFNNIRAINAAVPRTTNAYLLFYPYGTRHVLSSSSSSTTTDNDRQSSQDDNSWLSTILQSHAKKSPDDILGAMVIADGMIHSAGLSAAFSDRDKPTLYHRFQGFAPNYTPALKPHYSQQVDKKVRDAIVSVPLTGMIISKSLFQALEGFEVSLGDYIETIAVADLCARALEQGRRIIYNPKYSNQYYVSYQKLSDAEQQLGLSDETIELSPSEATALAHFTNRHHTYLHALITNNLESNAKVVWDFGAGSCTGWFIEAQLYSVSLESRVHMRVVTGRGDMCKGLPSSSIKSMDRMISRDLHHIDIFITHKPPDRYPSFPYNGLVKIEGIPKFIVGRSMYESVIIPPSWAKTINTEVDETWVPSKFLVDAFIENGVQSSKVVHVPEPMDIHFYDPSNTTPLFTKQNAKNLKGFNFLSVFKWEPRKGPEELLEAYFTTFSKDDDVSLHLVTYVFMDRNGRKKWRVQQEIDDIIERLELDPDQLPAYDIITDVIPTVDMPRLYKSFDAYVLPSKGEGWGLPYIEAMTMGLPTIGTNYGGQLDFMNERNSYLIKTDGTTKKTEWDGTISVLPKIDMDSLKNLMREVYENRGEGRRKGQIARSSVSDGFSQEVISDMVLGHIKRIQTRILQNEQQQQQPEKRPMNPKPNSK